MIARVMKFLVSVSNEVTSHVLHLSVFTDFSRSQRSKPEDRTCKFVTLEVFSNPKLYSMSCILIRCTYDVDNYHSRLSPHVSPWSLDHFMVS